MVITQTCFFCGQHVKGDTDKQYDPEEWYRAPIGCCKENSLHSVYWDRDDVEWLIRVLSGVGVKL